MTILIQNQYEIIGVFAPISMQHPRHNCVHAPILDEDKLKAFNNLMANPNLPLPLKIQIAERFEDFICHFHWELTEAEKLEWIKERISRGVAEWRKNPDYTQQESIYLSAPEKQEPEVEI